MWGEIDFLGFLCFFPEGSVKRAKHRWTSARSRVPQSVRHSRRRRPYGCHNCHSQICRLVRLVREEGEGEGEGEGEREEMDTLSSDRSPADDWTSRDGGNDDEEELFATMTSASSTATAQAPTAVAVTPPPGLPLPPAGGLGGTVSAW